MRSEAMLACALALGAFGCDEDAPRPKASLPAPAAAGSPNVVHPEHPLGDFLPIAVTLDCSKVGDVEPPWTVYVQIEAPHNVPGSRLVGRIEGEPCAEHDVSKAADAPALALLCPPRQLMEYDTACYATHHDILVTVCSPGFEPHSVELRDSGCTTPPEREEPSCGDVARLEVGDYEYEPIVYQPVPKPDGSGYCLGFEKAPELLLEGQTTFSCPCAGGL